MQIQDQLFALQDREYAAFQAKLTPGIPAEHFIGVRVPQARKLAKALIKSGGYASFLEALPHRYFDEDLLHGLLISQMRDFSQCIRELDRFLPYVDNWAVCDTISPGILKKDLPALLEKIRSWTASAHEYTCRFGMETLMRHYLDAEFRPEFLEIPASVHRDEYYVRMMIAWFYATALAKQWDAALPYLTGSRLDPWTHNKTIQKARESFRITPEQKAYLATLKRKTEDAAK